MPSHNRQHLSISARTHTARARSVKRLTQAEETLLNHTISPGDLGALTYFWITGGPGVAEARIRIYVDGEPEPSLSFNPAKYAPER